MGVFIRESTFNEQEQRYQRIFEIAQGQNLDNKTVRKLQRELQLVRKGGVSSSISEEDPQQVKANWQKLAFRMQRGF